MIRSLALLVGGSLAFWLLLAYPAWLVGGAAGVIFSAVAGALCLVPTVVTFLWCAGTARGTPEQRLLAVMGGSGARLAVVLGIGIALFHGFPYFHYKTFWIWIIVFYLFTLALEVGLLLTHPSAVDRP